MPDRGRIEVGGTGFATEMAKSRQRKAASAIRKKCAMVFQEFNLFPHRSVLGNVIEGLIVVQKVRRSEAEAQGRRLLKRVGLEEKWAERPRNLSGGHENSRRSPG